MTKKDLQDEELELVNGGGSLVYSMPENATPLTGKLNEMVCDNYSMDPMFGNPLDSLNKDDPNYEFEKRLLEGIPYIEPPQWCAYCVNLIGYDTPDDRTYFCRNISNLHKINN